MRSINAAHSVVSRQLFVQEREIRCEQINDAAVLFQLSIEEKIHFLNERDAQVIVEPWEVLICIRREQPYIPNLQPLFEKILHQRRSRARICEHAPYLPVKDIRIA